MYRSRATETTDDSAKSRKRKRSESIGSPAPSNSGLPPRHLPTKQLNEDGILAYLDGRAAHGPFNIDIQPLSRKNKTANSQDFEVDMLFEERLQVRFTVRPSNVWNAMKRYKRFTVGDAGQKTDISIGDGECIFVKHDEWTDATIDTSAQWKAMVLEVRAIDQEHVYLLVAWLNRPEDLDGGRKSYHGRNELIPSNHLDVIDAMSVNGRFNLVRWKQLADDIPAPEHYFWRHTYDAAYTKTFSELERFCVEDAPYNPDDIIVQCDKAECKQWMHVKCIAKDAARKTSGKRSSKKGTARKSVASEAIDVTLDPDSTAVGKAVCDGYTAEVFIKDARLVRHAVDANEDSSDDTEDVKPVTTSRIVISGPSGLKESQAVHCLLCQGEMA